MNDAMPEQEELQSHDGVEARLVAIARGHLAQALMVLPPTCAAALDACAAWSCLEEPGVLPGIDEMVGVGGPQDSLDQARAVLLDATRAASTGARALSLARAVREVEAALTALGSPSGPQAGAA